MKREAVVAVLASEGLALVSVSARTASSVVVVPTPTDPMEFRKSTRDLKARSAANEHPNEVRGGGRDPGVGRPGAGPGRSPARSQFVCSYHHPVHTCLYVRVRETGDWDIFLGPLEWARAETGGAD